MLNDCVAEFGTLSVARRVKLHVCGAAGVPDIVPVAASSDNPPHNTPSLRAHLTGGTQLAVCGRCD